MACHPTFAWRKIESLILGSSWKDYLLNTWITSGNRGVGSHFTYFTGQLCSTDSKFIRPRYFLTPGARRWWQRICLWKLDQDNDVVVVETRWASTILHQQDWNNYVIRFDVRCREKTNPSAEKRLIDDARGGDCSCIIFMKWHVSSTTTCTNI